MNDCITLNIPELLEKIQIYVHPAGDHCVSATLKQQRIWEIYETALVLRYLNAGDVFVDVGANIGYYSILASHLVGKTGRVLSYEPEVANFNLLCRNISLNQLSNVHAFQAALSDTDNIGSLFLNPENFGDHQIYDNGESRHRQTIQLADAYRHISDHSEHINFLKLDTQGAEDRILSSLAPLILANRQHLFMIVECWPAGLRRAESNGQVLIERLDSFGMQMTLIDHLSHRLIPVDKSMLLSWVNEVDETLGNEGFINLFLGPCA